MSSPSSPNRMAHRSSPSRSFLLARKQRGLRGLHLDSSHAAGQIGGYEEAQELRGSLKQEPQEIRYTEFLTEPLDHVG